MEKPDSRYQIEELVELDDGFVKINRTSLQVTRVVISEAKSLRIVLWHFLCLNLLRENKKVKSLLLSLYPYVSLPNQKDSNIQLDAQKVFAPTISDPFHG